jgi:hypothetical protein
MRAGTKLLLLCCIFIFLETSAYAYSPQVKDLQDLPSASTPVINTDQVLPKNSWAYKTLESISKKYDTEHYNEKFSADKPLTRNEAAYILVGLMGQIEENKAQITEYEKGKLEGVQQELQQEIATLKGRVDKLEISVNALQGNITKIQDGTNKGIQIGYGDKFKIDGAIQFKYNGNIAKGNDSNSSLYSSGFNIAVSDFNMNGQVAPHLRYVMEIFPSRILGNGSASLSPRGLLADTYLATDIIKNNIIYIGQERVPLGQEGAGNPYTTDFANKSQIARNYGDYRAPGVKLAGSYPFIDYSLGIFNGNRDNGIDTVTRQQEGALWATLKPFYRHPEWGKLELGGGYDVGKSDYANIATPFSHNNTGVYGAYTRGKYAIKSEFALQRGYISPSYTAANTTYPTTNVTSRGWYINNSYFLTKNLQLESRFDVFDPKTNVDKNLSKEYSVGANYFMLDKHLKLVLDYVFVQNELVSAKNSSRIVTMTQYQF